ncbi:IS6 family transposase [Umboniibacter marinipuniceus]|uniref:IS6 family transposase n=1 Tax=Umboniibacter marinipuniceus TaxID=569599 RepID=UPI003CCC6789
MSIYKRHRFSSDVIQFAVWASYKFSLSLRDVEDLLAERGIDVSRESIRSWCRKFGRIYQKRLRSAAEVFGDTWFMDEVFINNKGERHYLWRAVDQDGDVIDVLVQKRRDTKAAKRFFRRLLVSNRQLTPRTIVTDKLGSYRGAHRALTPNSEHDTMQYRNNRSESSHEPTRVRERQMRRFKSRSQAQHFLNVHSAVYNLFNIQRHLCSAALTRLRRDRAFACWREITVG